MAKKNRKRYRTRRERFREHARVYRLVFIFGLIFLAAWLFFFGDEVYNYLKLYFLDWR